jgi:hypothetical protein
MVTVAGATRLLAEGTIKKSHAGPLPGLTGVLATAGSAESEILHKIQRLMDGWGKTIFCRCESRGAVRESSERFATAPSWLTPTADSAKES